MVPGNSKKKGAAGKGDESPREEIEALTTQMKQPRPPRKASSTTSLRKSYAQNKVGDDSPTAEEPDMQVARALVNRLQRADLEKLLLECISDGALPLAKVEEQLPENQRSLLIESVQVVSKALRDSSAGSFAVLPAEIQLMIFALLPFYDRLRAAVFVCPAWRELLSVESLWRDCDFTSKRFSAKSVLHLFGKLSSGGSKSPNSTEATLDACLIEKIAYTSEPAGVKADDLKKLLKLTPGIRDIWLGGRSVSETTALLASKLYAPNLVRLFLGDGIDMKTDSLCTILEANPGLTRLRTRITHPIGLVDFDKIANAGAAKRPGGVASSSPLIELDISSRCTVNTRAVLHKMGTWFPELEKLTMALSTAGVERLPGAAEVPPAVEMPRMRFFSIRVSLFDSRNVQQRTREAADEVGLAVRRLLLSLDLDHQIHFPPSTPPFLVSQQHLRDLYATIHGICHRTLVSLSVIVNTQVLGEHKIQTPFPDLGTSLTMKDEGWPELRQFNMGNTRVGQDDFEGFEAPLLQAIGQENDEKEKYGSRLRRVEKSDGVVCRIKERRVEDDE